MKRLRQTDEYTRWIKKLRDGRTRSRVNIRVMRLAEGNPGEGRFLREIAELKIDCGPGYRVYYKDTGKEIILLLCGGDKSTQQEETNYGTN